MVGYIRRLIDESIATESAESRENCLSKVASLLTTDPDQVENFISYYILKNEKDDYISRGLEIARRLCADDNFDYRALIKVIKDRSFKKSYRLDAIRSVALLINKVDESVYSELLNDEDDEIRLIVIESVMINISTLIDREKAFRLTKTFLKFSKHAEPVNFDIVLGAFVYSFDSNKDIYSKLLTQNLEPHEAVIISVSYLQETWPNSSPYRVIAEENSKKSHIAKMYLDRYLKFL